MTSIKTGIIINLWSLSNNITLKCKKGLNWGEEETRTFLELCREADYFINGWEKTQTY